jgi:transposase
MEACVGAHHLSRKLKALGHDARLMPAKYVRPYSKGQKNYFRDAEAIAEAVQRPTMKFVATKTAEQLDLQALHRVRERLVSQPPASPTKSGPFCWSEAGRPAGTTASPAPIAATMALEMIGPMPGTLISRSHPAFGKGRDFAAWLGLVPQTDVDRRPHHPRQDI